MKLRHLSLILITIALSAHIQAQPPAEIDQAIRAAVQLLMELGNGDYKGFINKFYSKKLKAKADLPSLENELRKIKESTAGAGGIDVANENGVFQILFSEGKDATVQLAFDEEEPGKIRSLVLMNKKEASQMTEEEKIDQALQRTFRKIESLSAYTEEAELLNFIQEHFTTSFLSKTSEKELLETLKKVGTVVAGSMTINARPAENGKGAVLEFRGGKSADVSFSIEEREPYRIDQFDVNTNIESSNTKPRDLLPIAWENYKEQIKKEEDAGFSGVVLMVRNGKIIHHAGYGFANRENRIKNSGKTLFDIGSIPIDFTRAAILRLVDQGEIAFSDPITKFIDRVPDDKKQITIEQLMTNRSGLHNFHHDESKDQYYDLTWISRDEAIRRILSRTLLFEPGTDVLQSHSAYGLLAAIVEIVSGQTYEAYLAEHFFGPMKMKNTGPYGNAPGLKTKAMAAGYAKQVSDPNIPALWGPASWLIKGSGGMVSNPRDLYLWNKGLQKGDFLSEKSKEMYRFGFRSIGGSERGFFSGYLRDSDNTVIICGNSPRSEYPDPMNLLQSLLALYKK